MKNINLKDYLKTVYTLETSLREQQTLINELNGEIKVYQMGLSILETPQGIDDTEVLMRMCLREDTPYKNSIQKKALPKLIYYFNSDFFQNTFAISLFIFCISQVLIKSLDIIIPTLLLSFTSCFIYQIIKFFLDTRNTKIENKMIEKENIKIKQNNLYHLEKRNIQLNNFKKELNVLKKSSYETKQLLNDIYNLNIIFPKYRNIIAVSSFYEYICSGRCEILEGHEGAYNKFENEIRLNLIINKLDKVLEKLDEIKNNQYMLYTAIMESNRKSNSIITQLKEIQNQNIDIINNGTIARYNSEIISQNTEFLKWYHIFKN